MCLNLSFIPQTLQHLVWILGLKPVTGGGLSSSGVTGSSSASAGGGPQSSAAGSVSQPPSENNSVITTAVMADLPVLSNMVTRLFESSGKCQQCAQFDFKLEPSMH